MCPIARRKVVLVSLCLSQRIHVGRARFVKIDYVLGSLFGDLNRPGCLVAEVLHHFPTFERATRQRSDENGCSSCSYHFVGKDAEVCCVLCQAYARCRFLVIVAKL
jgi:hypothetical protein